MNFDDLVTQYGRTIRSAISRILTDPDDRAECMQDVLLSIFRCSQSGSLPTGPTMTSYIISASRKRALQFRRNNLTRSRTISSSIDSPRPGESEPTYDDARFADPVPVTSDPMTRAIADAAEILPDSLRDVVRLRYFDDLDISEIAVHLGIAETTVRNRLSRAIATMKNTFNVSDISAA